MSSIPRGIFIQQSDEGTDVFFLVQVGIAASPTTAEVEWQVEKQHHIPKGHVFNFFGTTKSSMPKGTSVEFDPESLWFVQHEVDLS
jgi:hypothetical protein